MSATTGAAPIVEVLPEGHKLLKWRASEARVDARHKKVVYGRIIFKKVGTVAGNGGKLRLYTSLRRGKLLCA